MITSVRSPAPTLRACSAGHVHAEPAVDQVKLQSLLPENPFFIPRERVEEMKAQLGCDSQELLQALVPEALPLAHPDVSHHNVGQASLGESGNIYLSVNLEFPGNDPHQTVHGEQFMVVNAKNHGEKRLVAAAMTGSPCGNCRQFLHETNHGDEMNLLLYNRDPQAPNYGKLTTLAQLNPEPFGDGGNLLDAPEVPLQGLVDARRNDDKALDDAALAAARGSYVRKYHTAAGVGLKLADGSLVKGSYLEISGQNPSLSPLQSALVTMVAEGRPWSSIKSCVLVEEQDSPFSQQAVTRALLDSVAPGARLSVRHAER